ncbi:hypothetical protein pb186bvf_015137 [Paramecium bursaria]
MLEQSVSSIKLKAKSLTSIQKLLGVYQMSKIIKMMKLKYKEKHRSQEIEKKYTNFQLVVEKALLDLKYFKKCVLDQRQIRREILNNIVEENADADNQQNKIKYQDYLQAIQLTLLQEEQVLISQIQYYCINNNIHYDNQFVEQKFNRILLMAKSFGKESFLDQKDIEQNFQKMINIISSKHFIIENIISKIINYSKNQILKIMNIVVLDIQPIVIRKIFK